VSYQDGGQLRVDLIGGHVDMINANHAGFSDVANSGKGVFIAFFTDKRFEKTWPNVPTVKEVVKKRGGDPDAVPVFPYFRFLALSSDVKKKYPERYDRWVKALQTIAANAKFQKWGEEHGLTITWDPPSEVREKSINFEKYARKHANLFKK